MCEVSRSSTAEERDGISRAINSAPCTDLKNHIGRHFAMTADQSFDQSTVNVLVNDAAFVRILTRGYWETEVEPGRWQECGGALLFGAQSRPTRVRVQGPVQVVGFSIRPGAWPALFDAPASALADTLTPIDALWPGAGARLSAAAQDVDPDKPVFDGIEAIIRERVVARGHRPVDDAMIALEHIARTDPSRQVADISRELGISSKQLQRRALHCFGHTPKMVLRRSRFLDVAAVLRGIAVPGEEALCVLRYYDQSHVNREFRRFVGMTPAQFERTPTPILTLGIQVRQSRKLQESAA